MTGLIQVFTTVDSEKTAGKIAHALLVERTAACVQVFGPFKSSYWWKGKIRHSKEWFCIAKVIAKDYDAVEAKIKKTHPYDIPEILAVPVPKGNPDYLKWVKKETTRRTRSRRHRPENPMRT